MRALLLGLPALSASLHAAAQAGEVAGLSVSLRMPTRPCCWTSYPDRWQLRMRLACEQCQQKCTITASRLPMLGCRR